MKEKRDNAAEAFLKGLDHEVTLAGAEAPGG